MGREGLSKERWCHICGGSEVVKGEIIQDPGNFKKQQIKEWAKGWLGSSEAKVVEIWEERQEEIQRSMCRPLHPKPEQDISTSNRQH